MTTKAILLSIADQLDDAIAKVRDLVPPEKVCALCYETSAEFWKDVEERSKGWDLSFKFKDPAPNYWGDRPKFEDIEEVIFWPQIRPLTPA